MSDVYRVFTIEGDDDDLTYFEEVTFAIREKYDGWGDSIATRTMTGEELDLEYNNLQCIYQVLVLEPGRFAPYGGGTYGPPGTFMKSAFTAGPSQELSALHHNANLFYTLWDKGYLKAEFALSLFQEQND